MEPHKGMLNFGGHSDHKSQNHQHSNIRSSKFIEGKHYNNINVNIGIQICGE